MIVYPMTDVNTGKDTSELWGTSLVKFLLDFVYPIRNARGIIKNKSQYRNSKSEGRDNTK